MRCKYYAHKKVPNNFDEKPDLFKSVEKRFVEIRLRSFLALKGVSFEGSFKTEEDKPLARVLVSEVSSSSLVDAKNCEELG